MYNETRSLARELFFRFGFECFLSSYLQPSHLSVDHVQADAHVHIANEHYSK